MTLNRRIWALAWPLLLSNMTAPLLVLARALLMSALLSGLLIIVNPWLRDLGLALLGGGDEVQALAGAYIDIRILGAPAALVWRRGRATE